MKNEKPYKPTKTIDGYEMRKHQHGGFRIIEYSHYSNEGSIRKRTIYKHLSLTDAEDKLYRLEASIKK